LADVPHLPIPQPPAQTVSRNVFHYTAIVQDCKRADRCALWENNLFLSLIRSKKYLKNVFVDNISVFRPWTFRCMKEGSIRIHCPFILLYWEHGLEPDSGPQGNAGIWKFA